MFEHNWRGQEYGKYEKVCMLRCKMDVQVWKIVYQLLVCDVLGINLKILMIETISGKDLF